MRRSTLFRALSALQEAEADLDTEEASGDRKGASVRRDRVLVCEARERIERLL
jgi:hypothetical protein